MLNPAPKGNDQQIAVTATEGAALIGLPEKIEFLNAGVVSYSPIIYHKKIKYLLDAGLRFDERGLVLRRNIAIGKGDRDEQVVPREASGGACQVGPQSTSRAVALCAAARGVQLATAFDIAFLPGDGGEAFFEAGQIGATAAELP